MARYQWTSVETLAANVASYRPPVAYKKVSLTVPSISRRRAIAIIGGVLFGVAFRVNPQTSNRVRRIGNLGLSAEPSRATLQRNWEPMRELGWIEGQNVIHEDRWTTDPAMLHQYAKELVELNVEIIVTVGTAATLAAKAATSRIPIVMYSSGDPVRVGLVQSLSRPGGNITGYAVLAPELDTKRLEMVREILPEVQRIGVLHNPSNPYYELTRVETERMYRSFNVRAIVIEVKRVGEVENAVAEAVRQHAQALLVNGDLDFDLPALVDAAMKHSLPTIADDREFVKAGCLLSLQPDDTDQSRAFAYVMDRILRGAKPADIPIQQPRKLLLAINLKTARALGIAIPQSLRLRVDEVFE